jgi:hypothetical protein
MKETTLFISTLTHFYYSMQTLPKLDSSSRDKNTLHKDSLEMTEN